MQLCNSISAEGVLDNATTLLAAAYRLAVLQWRVGVSLRNKPPNIYGDPPPEFNPATVPTATADGSDTNANGDDSAGGDAPQTTPKPAHVYKRGISDDAPVWHWFNWKFDQEVMEKYLLDPELSEELRKEVEVAAAALVDTHAFFYFPNDYHQDSSFARWPEAYGVFNLISAWFATIGAVESGHASKWIRMVLDRVHDEFPDPTSNPALALATKFAPCRPRTMLTILLQEPLQAASFEAVCQSKHDDAHNQYKLQWLATYSNDVLMQLSVKLGLRWKQAIEVADLAAHAPADEGADSEDDMYAGAGAHDFASHQSHTCCC